MKTKTSYGLFRMKRNNHKSLWFTFGLCSVATIASAQLPRSRPPQNFDRATVDNLITNIDTPRSAAYLKSAYFMRRDPKAYPVEQGWKLLQAATAQEKAGSKRWFIYANVKAFAAFRLPAVDTKEGFAAYSALFDQTQNAPKVAAEYYVAQAISEFINSIPGRLEQDGVNGDMMMPAATIKAWQAFSVARQWKPITRNGLEPPDWIAALDITGVPEKFPALLENQLADKSLVSYELLSVAAHVFLQEKPQRAVELLKQAKPLLPLGTDGKPEPEEANRFYTEIDTALQMAGKPEEALVFAKERTRILGNGRAEQVALLKAGKDETAVDAIIVELSRPQANGNEIVAVADVLSAAALDTQSRRIVDEKSATQLTALFESYLAAPRRRSPFNEMRTRLQLAWLYENRKEWEKAKAVLLYPSAATSPRDKKLLQVMKQQREALMASHP